jgi:hypothetical protein
MTDPAGREARPESPMGLHTKKTLGFGGARFGASRGVLKESLTLSEPGIFKSPMKKITEITWCLWLKSQHRIC